MSHASMQFCLKDAPKRGPLQGFPGGSKFYRGSSSTVTVYPAGKAWSQKMLSRVKSRTGYSRRFGTSGACIDRVGCLNKIATGLRSPDYGKIVIISFAKPLADYAYLFTLAGGVPHIQGLTLLHVLVMICTKRAFCFYE